jgi:hypothetical protein
MGARRSQSSLAQLAAHDPDDVGKAWWDGQVFAHLGAPPLAVAFNAAFEPLGEHVV